MDDYRELAERLKGFIPQNTHICQGIVSKVDGITCTVEIGGLSVPGVRLRATEMETDDAVLVVPKIGSAVIVGSLTGQLDELVVLVIDRAESVTFNGGKMGGMVNVSEITKKLNSLIDALNTHTHPTPNGLSSPPTAQFMKFNKSDYEDEKITH